MKPQLIHQLFWASDARVYLWVKPARVIRYHIYCSLNPLRLVKERKLMYNFQNDEILEVTTIDLKRFFFQYDKEAKRFKELFFPDIEDEYEGENLLLRHLGLLPSNEML